MSYNIDSSEYKSGKLTISAAEARRLIKKHGDNLPEGCFLNEIDTTEDGDLEIKDFWWYGEGSGHAYHEILEDILAKTKGKATLLFVWEGGDSHTGLKVNNGKVSEAKVKIELE